jgi:hypothetical protein
MTRHKALAVTVAGTAAAALAIAPAWGSGSGRTTQSESFFASGNASAHWDNTQSSDANRFSQRYTVNDATSYAGTTLHHVEGQPAPANSPTFSFKASQAGPSGGSPRLVMVFGDPTTGATVGNIALTPDNWDTNWQAVGDGSWAVNGGTCGFKYHDQYDDAVACMGDAVVTNAFMVTDSGWLYPTGYTNWVDQIQYGGKTISQPSDNNNSGS